jgi:hypothetical protein
LQKNIHQIEKIQKNKNMKYLIILLLFLCHSSFSQSNLSYAKSETPYVAPPTKEILQLMNNREYNTSLEQNNAIKCDKLIEFIKKEGTSYQDVSHYSLYNSSWLYEVKSYKYKENIFVIATIKKDDISYIKNDYIFCNISEQRWKAFYDPYNLQDRRSYGEKFNDFIIDKVCNCE